MNTYEKTPPDFLHRFLTQVPLHRAFVRAAEAQLIHQLALPYLQEPIGDIGSGDGSFAKIVFGGKNIMGFDPLCTDTRAAAGYGCYQGLSVANGETLPIRDKSFASVVSNCVLEHVVLLNDTLREIYRILQPGGLFVATVVGNHFAADLLGTALLNLLRLNGERYGRWFNKISVHYHTLSASEWRERFSNAGFEVVCQYPYLDAVSLKLFDFFHYFSAPALITRKLTGRWFIAPQYTPNLLWKPLLSHILAKQNNGKTVWRITNEEGPYYFFICQKPIS